MSELNEINTHIEELRKRVIRSVISVLVITVFILTFHATPVDVMGVTLYYPYPEPLDNIAAQFTNVMKNELVPETFIQNPHLFDDVLDNLGWLCPN